ncbi:MAG: hypothetical protein AAGD23_06030 [Pseudomonadota bacterium]
MNWLELNKIAKERGDGFIPQIEQALGHCISSNFRKEEHVISLAEYSNHSKVASGPIPAGSLAGSDLTNVVLFPTALTASSHDK